MESRIISLFLLMTAAGCWATLPIPYLAFRVQGVPAQPFVFDPPQRSFLQQLFPNYEPLRYSQPETYSQPQFYVQPQPYVQPQNYAYNLYNQPQPAQRDGLSPLFSDHYDTVLHYVQRQPLVPFPNYSRKGQLLQGPPTKPYFFQDCREKETEPETMNKKLSTNALAEPIRRMSTEMEFTPEELPTVKTRISGEENTKSGNGEITQENDDESMNFENQKESAIPTDTLEDTLEKNSSENKNSGEKIEPPNPAESQNQSLKENAAESTNSGEKADANLLNPLDVATNSPNPTLTIFKDEATTAELPNPQKEALQDSVIGSTESLDKLPTRDSGKFVEGINQEAATESDQQNPTTVVSSTESNETLAASTFGQTESVGESTSAN